MTAFFQYRLCWMDRRPLLLPLLWLFVAAVALSLTGCSGQKKKELRYVALNVETIYNEAHNQFLSGNHFRAGRFFDEVERQHPYSIWARRAQLMGAYSYYLSGNYNEAVLTAQRFLSIHPGNKHAAYAYYLIAVSYYEQISDVRRDQKITHQALKALTDLVKRFPNTPYAADSKIKIGLTLDHLAAKDMRVGRWYLSQGNYIAASKRFHNVVKIYDKTSYVPEALHRIVECSLLLGLQSEAKRIASVLGHNFPGSKWYKRSYELIAKAKAG